MSNAVGIVKTDVASELRKFVVGMEQTAGNAAKQLEQVHNTMMDGVWNDGKVKLNIPGGKTIEVQAASTIEQKLEALSTDAKTYFMVAAGAGQLCVLVDPTATDRLKKVPEEWMQRIAFNDDGSFKF